MRSAAAVVQGLSLAGWGIVLLSTFLISHFELFGLTQVVRNWLGRSTPEPVFHTPMFYKHVRHPLYFGFLIAFWAAPRHDICRLLPETDQVESSGWSVGSFSQFKLVNLIQAIKRWVWSTELRTDQVVRLPESYWLDEYSPALTLRPTGMTWPLRCLPTPATPTASARSYSLARRSQTPPSCGRPSSDRSR